MKIITLPLCFFLISFCLSCSTEEETFTESSSSSSETTTPTQLFLKVINENSVPKANYTVLMFEEPVDITEPLPPIEMRATSNGEGVAQFDLDDYLGASESKLLYFEAFIEQPNGNLVLKSITHPELIIEKNTKRTTSILVMD